MKLSKLQTNGEEIANAISHGVMVFFGIAILTVMLIHCNGDGYRIAGAIIYGTATILLYTFSCLYHAITNHFAKTVVLKRFDHISIYLLIGGTYAPILLCFPYFQDTASFIPGLSLGVLILIIEWILIVCGITFKSIWLRKKHWIHLALYLILGWTSIFFMGDIYHTDPAFFWFVLAGGLAYTIGVVFYVLSKVYYFHFVWHIFVCAATILHALGIILYIYN